MRMGHFSFFWSSGSVSTSSRLEYRLPWEKPAVTVNSRAACNFDCRTTLTHLRLDPVHSMAWLRVKER